MLSDRSYMHYENGRQGPSFLVCLLATLAAVFVLQRVGEVFFGSQFLLRHGAFSADNLLAGKVWTSFTYALLHGSLTHLLLNGLGLFFIGRFLQDTLGPKRLAWLTIIGALGAAAAWLGINFQRSGFVLGASGVVMAFLAVFACLQPRRPITVLLFFVIPITVQPIWLVGVIAGIDVLGLLTQELPGSGTLYGIAHSAHLGGLAAGWLFHRYVLAGPVSLPSIEPPAWLRKNRERAAPAYRVDVGGASPLPRGAPAATPPPASTREALRAEVDRILDKINLHGFGSLTDAEKRVLDEARQHLSPR
jgi:membrane associated rhomboid family serine protease